MAIRMTTPSKRTTFFLLMIGSALLLATPSRFLQRPAGEMTQLIAYPQWAVHQAAMKASEPLRTLARRQLTAEEQARLEEERNGLENENAVLRQQTEALQQRIGELTMLRQEGLGADGIVIPAAVIAREAMPRQDSLLIGQGRAGGARQSDWVASRLFVQAGRDQHVPDDAAVLSRQCLIGWIEQTATFTSRVVLLSDRHANRAMRVHVAHRDAATRQPRLVLLDGQLAEFVLRGAGQGRMIIRDIKDSFIEAGVIAPGDLVLSDARDARLGHSLVIGQIEELRHNREQPLLYDAVVCHRFDPRALSEVLIVSRSSPTSAER